LGHITKHITMEKKRVTGIGGIFVQYENPDQVKDWYAKHLGLKTDAYGTTFEWRQVDQPEKKGFTQWSTMDKKSDYMAPSTAGFMVNYRVENLEWLVETLRKEGVTVLDEIETYDYGKFVHILDPEGIKVELWEPVDEEFDGIAEGKTK